MGLHNLCRPTTSSPVFVAGTFLLYEDRPNNTHIRLFVAISFHLSVIISHPPSRSSLHNRRSCLREKKVWFVLIPFRQSLSWFFPLPVNTLKVLITTQFRFNPNIKIAMPYNHQPIKLGVCPLMEALFTPGTLFFISSSPPLPLPRLSGCGERKKLEKKRTRLSSLTLTLLSR